MPKKLERLYLVVEPRRETIIGIFRQRTKARVARQVFQTHAIMGYCEPSELDILRLPPASSSRPSIVHLFLDMNGSLKAFDSLEEMRESGENGYYDSVHVNGFRLANDWKPL